MRVASLPGVLEMNPYQRLFYRSLEAEGIALEPRGRLSLRWLVAQRGRVDVLHIHWPESLYTLQRGPRWLRSPGSWAKLVVFAARLRAARLLGYRIVWTIHQPLPHRRSPLDRPAARILARSADVLLAHDEQTRRRAADVLGARVAARIALIPHGSYAGVYPPRRSRESVRAELGLGDAFVFLSFGELRAHKCWRLVLRAFRSLERDDLALVVAGLAKDAAVRAQIAAEAAGDPRIRLLLDFVPEPEVGDLFAAADAAIVARDDGGTSGSLVLPLSLGVPVVAASCPAYRALLHGEEAGWLFEPGDVDSLRAALVCAASDSEELARRGRAAAAAVPTSGWAVAAERTARLLAEAR